MSRIADVARLRDEIARNPGDRVAWHNLAAAFGDLGHAAQAEEAARRALALGIPAPETRLVLARALQTLRRYDEAERSYRDALALRPGYVDAYRDLAQLIWMRTADAQAALAPVDAALRAAPKTPALHLVRSVVLEFAGDCAGALAAAEAGLAHDATDAPLLQQAAHVASELRQPARAVDLARRADACAPGSFAIRATLCEVLLGAGDLAAAAPLAAALAGEQPLNQYALALQATVWRLQGDARYAAWCDHATLVTPRTLDVPPGYSSLDAFLDELEADLTSLHTLKTHPLQQSVRGGSQLHLQAAELARPPIAALFQVLQATVLAYLARLGTGTDPVRARNRGTAMCSGAWSVRLRTGGHHADHVHPHGWLSSACYIALPPTIGDGYGASPRAGWLRFGQPAFPTTPAQVPDGWVKPERGRLVLFPAYLWHGVEPFESDAPRLSVAFDIVPG